MAQHVVVETNCGKIRGIAENAVNVFKGIPYASPPEGEGRFAPPRKLQPWTEVRDAFDFGNRAMQDENAFAMPPAMLKLFAGRALPPMSENCLVLNVWTPAVNDGRKRPVMFWCHGGAFISGSGDSPWYDGTNLCRKGDVVVVTINHRLGAFGYLHLGDFGGEEFAASGNAGMLDIVAALEWVRDNIAAFGGDKGNVTIFGESGGGAKVSVLMAMPAAHGLFHKAIIQSGPAVQMASRDDASETARQLLAELGIDAGKVNELRQVPAQKLAEAQAAVLKKVSMMSFANRRRVGFNPVVDGKHLPGGPFEPTAPAISANVPLIIGTNKDEMNLFFGLAPWLDELDEAAMRKRVQMFVGDQADRIIEPYRRARPKDSLRDLVLAIATDHAMRMPSLVTADRKVAQHARAGVRIHVHVGDAGAGWQAQIAARARDTFCVRHCSDFWADWRFADAIRTGRQDEPIVAGVRAHWESESPGCSELAAVLNRAAAYDDVRQSVPGGKRSVSSGADGLAIPLAVSKVVTELRATAILQSVSQLAGDRILTRS